MKHMKPIFHVGILSTLALFQLSCSNGSNNATSPATANANSKQRTAYALAIDSSDNLYVLDQANARIQVYSGGILSKTITGFAVPGQPTVKLLNANAIAVDGAGNFYIVQDYQLIKYDPNGNFLAVITQRGTGISQFGVYQQGLAVDPTRGLVFVGDYQRVLVFNTQGIFQGTFGNGAGSLTCDFNALRALAVDSQGCVYATDNGNQRVMQWCSCGGACFTNVTPYLFPSPLSSGAAFNAAIDPSGNVFVADYNSNTNVATMVEFASNGSVINTWVLSPPIYPQATVVDSQGNLYQAYWDGLIRKYTNNGSLAATIVSDVP